MTTHRFVATEWHNVLGTLPPAFRVASGDTVITETLGGGGADKDGVKRRPGPNPMNGPIVSRAPNPGDSAQGGDLHMTPNRATGRTRSSLAANVMDPDDRHVLPRATGSPGPSIARPSQCDWSRRTRASRIWCCPSTR